MKASPDLGALAMVAKASISLPMLIGEVVPLKRQGRLWTACCPFHAEKTSSFRVYTDHYHCFGCGAHGDAIHWIKWTRGLNFRDAIEYLTGRGESRSANENILRNPVEVRTDDRASVEGAQRIWTESVCPRGTQVERYLGSRGLELPSGIASSKESVIRFHPSVWHTPGGRKWPAMIALMVDPVTGAPQGVHRTFLMRDGSDKAPIDRQKMMLGRGGVIRLDKWQGDGLAIAEGIETSLSIAQRIGSWPIWVAGSAGMISTFPPLEGVALTIFSDADQAGRAAASVCMQRWAAAGREVRLYEPPVGQDWDDASRSLAA